MYVKKTQVRKAGIPLSTRHRVAEREKHAK